MLRLITLCCVLSLCACASNDRTPDEQAIVYAMVKDATLRKISDECSQVSAGLEQTAWRTRHEWWKRNGPLVEAADYGLTYNLISLSGERQETGAVYAMALTFDIVAKADEQTSALLQGNKKEECRNVMESYSSGENDLQANKDFYPLLVNLQRKKAQGGDAALQLKQAEVEKNSAKAYARSNYTVEKLVKRQGCPNAVVKALKADWPLEVYEAKCPDASYMLVRCDWGNCAIQH